MTSSQTSCTGIILSRRGPSGLIKLAKMMGRKRSKIGPEAADARFEWSVQSCIWIWKLLLYWYTINYKKESGLLSHRPMIDLFASFSVFWMLLLFLSFFLFFFFFFQNRPFRLFVIVSISGSWASFGMFDQLWALKSWLSLLNVPLD